MKTLLSLSCVFPSVFQFVCSLSIELNRLFNDGDFEEKLF